MNDVQIHVVSKEHFNSIIYQGPEAVSKIYLYFHDEHYDVITSMPAFLNRSYYCHSCHKGYHHREEHRRNNMCSSCHKIHEQSEDDWIYCLECNRYFKGTDCYELHRIITNKGISTRNYTPAPRRGRGYTVLPLSVCLSVQDIFRRIFLSTC